MKERGMIFNEYQVRALLDGSMTQTRRIMKDQPVLNGNFYEVFGAAWSKGMTSIPAVPGHSLSTRCPYGVVGDRIWVRETFATGLSTKSTLAYRATHKREDLEDGFYDTIKWTPSIHMPRWASRILLEITDVRVERLQDADEGHLLDELGAMLEYDNTPAGRAFSHAEHYAIAGVPVGMFPEMHGFKAWWDKVNGDGSFDSNPWVWVIEFKRVEGGAA